MFCTSTWTVGRNCTFFCPIWLAEKQKLYFQTTLLFQITAKVTTGNKSLSYCFQNGENWRERYRRRIKDRQKEKGKRERERERQADRQTYRHIWLKGKLCLIAHRFPWFQGMLALGIKLALVVLASNERWMYLSQSLTWMLASYTKYQRPFN